MGCRSDHMEPRAREAESKRVATFLVFIAEQTNQTLPAWVFKAAREYYGDEVRCDKLTDLLCTTIREMGTPVREAVVYNAHDAQARELAAWWEHHQQVDAERERKEAKEAKLREIANGLAANLTDEQKEAIRFAVKEGIV